MKGTRATQAYDAAMKHAEAETLERETWETRKRVLGPDHPDTSNSAKATKREARALSKQWWDQHWNPLVIFAIAIFAMVLNSFEWS